MKSFLRSLVPMALQVPVKYRVNRALGRMEPEVELLRYLVARGDRAIDVGGNRGVYAYALWRLGARVEVFEPNPICSDVLEAWSANKPYVAVHRVGLSDSKGEADLHIPVDTSGYEHDASASLGTKVAGRVRNERVPLSTLDSFAFNDVAFVKIDVEGHEDRTLLGAEALLGTQQPALLVEIEQRHIDRPITEVFDLVRSFGYEGWFLRDNQLAPLDWFVVERDQSTANFGTDGMPYLNNFLFLGRRHSVNGRYSRLQADWGMQ